MTGAERRRTAPAAACACLGAVLAGMPPPPAPAPQPGSGRRVVILLDRSASMQPRTVWQAAREIADTLFWKLEEPDRAVLVAFDIEVEPRSGWTGSVSVLKAGLWYGLQPGGRGTRPGAALDAAIELLDAPAAAEIQEIHLISDFQRTAFAGWSPRLPDGVCLVPHPVGVPSDENLRLGPAAVASDPDTGAVTISITVGRLRAGAANESWSEVVGAGWWPAGRQRLPRTPRRPELRLVAAPLEGGWTGLQAEVLSADPWPRDDAWFAAFDPEGQPGATAAPGARLVLADAAGPAGGVLRVTTPDGRELELGRGEPFAAPDRTGLYRVQDVSRPPGVRYLAVGSEPGESDPTPLSPPELAAWARGECSGPRGGR